MRKLTIKREIRTVACFVAMKVYIEDLQAGDVNIGGVKCRKIGEIKSGETVSFEIGDEATAVYVIKDRENKYCPVSRYEIEAGTEDISLKGCNVFNTMMGHPFYFYNGNAPLHPMSKVMDGLLGLITILVIAFIGMFMGYAITTEIADNIGLKAQTFETDEIRITLTNRFSEQYLSGCDAAFASEDVTVIAYKNSFSDVGGNDMSEEEYAQKILDSTHVTNRKVVNDDGLVYFNYTMFASDGYEYSYYVYTYKSDDAYWHIYFAVKKARASGYIPDIRDWAGSVRFK